jgi:hypothetical protein
MRSPKHTIRYAILENLRTAAPGSATFTDAVRAAIANGMMQEAERALDERERRLRREADCLRAAAGRLAFDT